MSQTALSGWWTAPGSTSWTLTVWRYQHTSDKVAHCSIYRPRRMKGWVGLQRTVYPHKWSAFSCKSSVGQGKHAGRGPTFYQLCYATKVFMPVTVVMIDLCNTFSSTYVVSHFVRGVSPSIRQNTARSILWMFKVKAIGYFLSHLHWEDLA